MMDRIRRIWLGEAPLQIMFWNWAVLGGLIVNSVSSAMFMFLLASDHVILALVVGYLFSVPYNVVIAVGVWRSADKYDGDRRWADAAKLATLVWMIVLSIS